MQTKKRAAEMHKIERRPRAKNLNGETRAAAAAAAAAIAAACWLVFAAAVVDTFAMKNAEAIGSTLKKALASLQPIDRLALTNAVSEAER